MTRRRVALAALAGLTLLGCGPLACAPEGAHTPGSVEARPEPLPVAVLVARREAGYGVNEQFAGRVVARRTSELGFERSGRLEAVLVDEGDRIEVGQPLARLEQRVLEARRRELGARVGEMEARLALARLTRERRQELRERESISAQRYDEAVHEEQALHAQLAAARAGLAAVGVELKLSTLAAPYAGEVTARLADEGTVLAPGQTVLRLIERDALEFRVGLPPETAQRLDPDALQSVQVGAHPLPVRLEAVVASIEPETRTRTAIFAFEDPPRDVEHGSLGRLALESRFEEPGFWLPLGALAESRRGLWAAYALALEDDGTAVVERRELELLHTEGDRAFVRGTLRDGDQVVANGVHRLVPGQRVRVAAE